MLKNYLKIAFRNLRINRTYTLLNILGLSMGIAGAILIFIFIGHHLRTDQHHPCSERIYRVTLDLLLDEGTEYGTDSSVPFATALARDYAQIEKVGFFRKNPNATLSSFTREGVKRFIEKDNVAFVNPDFLQMFSFKWQGEDAATALKEPNTVIISENIARKYFGTIDVKGRTLTLTNSIDLRIAGVIKEQVQPSDLIFSVLISLPTLKIAEPGFEMDNFGWLSSRNCTFVRLKDGANPENVENLLRKNGVKYYGDIAKYYSHQLQPLSEIHFDERYGGKIRWSVLWTLAGVGVFLIVIACINFVNLSTAQALKRSKEIGVRKVLGSTQRQLFFQFMSETALLAIGAACLALVLVFLVLPRMNDWVQTQAFDYSALARPEFVLLFMVLISCVTGFAGFYPSVVISGFNPISALKNKTQTNSQNSINLRRFLITTQMMIAQMMVIGTLVLILQLSYFKNADPGFDQNALISVSLPKSDHAKAAWQALRNSLLQYPSIRSATFQYEAPSSKMGYGGSVRFDNRSDWEKFTIRNRFGDSRYLPTYSMPLLAGRNISASDSITEFVVNEELMHKLNIQDPEKVLGRQLEDGNSGLKGEIVGVVKSFHLKSFHDAVEPCVIFNHPKLYKELAIKFDTKDVQSTIQTIGKTWQKAYPDEVFTYQFVDEQIARFYEKEEQLTTLIKAFAFLSITICCLGLYGMISFMVGQRTREIGVRKVLGASVESIFLLFGKEFLMLVSVAFMVSAPLSYYIMSSWLNDFAYRINLQWWILVCGGAMTLLATFLTISSHVIRAALANPVKSLRTE